MGGKLAVKMKAPFSLQSCYEQPIEGRHTLSERKPLASLCNCYTQLIRENTLPVRMEASPVYTTAIDEIGNDKGLGMRFPRLIRIRTDKKPIEATNPEFIYEIYKG